jgi:hypothetical protein
MIEYSWLVYGLQQAEYENPNNKLRLSFVNRNDLLLYQYGDRVVSLCYRGLGCIRVEGFSWGLIIFNIEGHSLRAMRGNTKAAEQDLFMLRMVLPAIEL